MFNNSPLYSPDGSRAVQFDRFEMRMSHWVESPIVMDTASGAVLFSLDGLLWSADRAEWSADSRRVTFTLRRYPGDAPGVTLEVDFAAHLAHVQTPLERETLSFAALPIWLEDWYARQEK